MNVSSEEQRTETTRTRGRGQKRGEGREFAGRRADLAKFPLTELWHSRNVPECSKTRDPARVPSHGLELTGSSRVPRVLHVVSAPSGFQTGIPGGTYVSRAVTFTFGPWLCLRLRLPSPSLSPSPAPHLPLPTSAPLCRFASCSRGSRPAWVPLKATCPAQVPRPEFPTSPRPDLWIPGSSIPASALAIPSYDLNTLCPPRSLPPQSLPAFALRQRSPIFTIGAVALRQRAPSSSSCGLNFLHLHRPPFITLVALFHNGPYTPSSSSAASDLLYRHHRPRNAFALAILSYGLNLLRPRTVPTFSSLVALFRRTLCPLSPRSLLAFVANNFWYLLGTFALGRPHPL